MYDAEGGGGKLSFMGDTVIHRLVDSTPWLATHSFVIQAAMIGTAGGYQLLSVKERCLAACRSVWATSRADEAPVLAGIGHAIDCVRSSWPLMVLMFAAGVANIAWMALLTALMAYETLGRQGIRVSRIAGFGLLSLALLALTSQGLPAFAA